MLRGEATSALASFHTGFLSWPLSWPNLNLECLCQWGGWENPEEIPRSKAKITNNLTLWNQAGIKRGPHWWDARALTTAPCLLPNSNNNTEMKKNLVSSLKHVILN